MKRILVVLLLLVVAACNRQEKAANTTSTGEGNAERGKQLVETYGCAACHVIPGVRGPKGMVGPSLEHMATRLTIAGKFPNTPKTMVSWLRNPQALDPQSAMPNLGVTPADARDLAAYMDTLK